MINLFVSYNYVGRYKDQYDKGTDSIIIEDRAEPCTQSDLEQLNAHIDEQLKEQHLLDSVSATIIYFKEVGQCEHKDWHPDE